MSSQEPIRIVVEESICMAENKDKTQPIVVTAKDLPLHCPLPDAPLWARHPRVFLDVGKSGEVTCPYCSARYVFQGELPAGH